MTVPVQIRRLPTNLCRRCGNTLRLHKSLQERACCCCRGTCNTEHEYGCVVCGGLLNPRDDPTAGVCVRCLIVLNGGTT